jgi:hypothetical protein
MTDKLKDRQQIIENSLKAYRDERQKRTLSVTYRGKHKDLPVVRLKTSSVLLNHDNSRLSAQLDGHPDKDIVHSAPASVAAQDVLVSLLQNTDKFNELKLQLKELGQLEPGLTTRDGLLINGNTRLAALMALEAEGHTDGIEVAVLPHDVTAEDLLDLEMGLQMSRLVHQDYSFTNELLMMDRYIKSGKTKKELAKKMAWLRNGLKKVDQHLRMLSIIEDVRRECSDMHMPYSNFDSKKQHIKDLDEEYERLKNSGDLIGAERLKWSRIAAIFLGVNKDQVRAIEDDFVEYEILKRVDDSGSGLADVKEFLEGYKIQEQDDGLGDIIDMDESSGEDINMRGVVASLLNSGGLRNDEGNINKDLDGVAAKLAKEMRLATDKLIQEQKNENIRVEPSKTLREARYDIAEMKKKLPEVSAMKDFKSGDFQYELKKLAKEVEAIQEMTQKYAS